MDDAVPAARYDGWSAEALAARLELPAVYLYDEVSSTLDVAHRLAMGGADDATLVVADRQRRGRGRGGKSWASEPAAGVWATVVLRPPDATTVGVLSLRAGLRIAESLDAVAHEAVMVKWPNDLLLREGKLAGILAEARWREREPEWVALGVGINVLAPPVSGATGLPDGTSRVDVLAACVRGVMAAARARGRLTPGEISLFDARHHAHGRACTEPRAGIVEGIDADGALLVRDGAQVHRVHAGSLRYQGMAE